MLTPELKAAFRYHRTSGKWQGRIHALPNAATALQRARDDVATGKARYPAERIYPAVTWQDSAVGNLPFPQYRNRLAHVEKPDHAGLRFVGRVVPETNRRDVWDSRGDCGWNTDPQGDVFKDGTGLCFGVVYQLPGRNGKARFVAGYEFGGTDSGPTINLSDLFEEDSRGNDRRQDMQAARDAARRADDMARGAAETEREYQTAYQAGSQYADAMAEIAAIRKSVLETIRAMKGACATLRGLPDVLRHRLALSIRMDLAERSKAFRRAAKLASGDDSRLMFYPSKELRAAFNEGAGRSVI